MGSHRKLTNKTFLSTLIIAILLLFSSTAWAAVIDWDGDGGDTDFDTATNWAGGVAPVVGDNGGDSLAFDLTGGAFLTVDGADGGAYAGLSGISFTGAGGSYSITGTGSLSFNATSTITGDGANTHTLAIDLTITGAGLTFDGAAGYTVSGVIADGAAAAALIKAGAGTLTLSGVNTYTGTTTINAGKVSIAADTGLGTAPMNA